VILSTPQHPRGVARLWSTLASVIALLSIGVSASACGTTPQASRSSAPHTSAGEDVLLTARSDSVTKSLATQVTPQFEAPEHWNLRYSYDCGESSQPKLNIRVLPDSGQPEPGPVDAVHASKGSGTASFSGAGLWRLEVASTCRWKIAATADETTQTSQ
jgi:hypothetical protein